MKRFAPRRIKELRQQRGWSVEDVARRARVTPRTVLYVEKGHAEPKARTLAGLAEAFGLPIDDLFVEVERRRLRPSEVAVAP